MNADRRIIVVGAGPAGLAASLAFAEAGVGCLLVDDNARAGGQIFRRGPAPAAALPGADNRGDALRAALERSRDRIDYRPDTQVVAASHDRRLWIAPAHGPVETVAADAIIVATGAIECHVPVPGWTLPGVYALGGLQVLLKQAQIAPAGPVVLAGAGPLLYLVTAQLLAAGTPVAAVVDAAAAPSPSALAAMARAPRLLAKGLGYLLAIRRHRVPVHRGCAVVAIEGVPAVSSVKIARLDDDWTPQRDSSFTLAAATVGMGFGLRPNIELAALLGCATAYAPAAGGWTVTRNADLETSQALVFAAGDGAAIGGVDAALADGTIAAAAALARLGRHVPPALAARAAAARRQRHRLRSFQAGLAAWGGVRPGIFQAASPDTLICRCEGIARATIDRVAAAGYVDFRTAKLNSRVAMGLCQGRICGFPAAHLIARAGGSSVERVGPANPRIPLRPIELSQLVDSGGPEMHRADS